MNLKPGTIVANQYEILGPLGRGGMGELFRARNIRTERRVALKLLRPHAKQRADVIERFRREARAAGLISSDHVTQVLGVDEDPKLGIAIAFELLDGENLLDCLRRGGAMSLTVLHPIVSQILRGLCDAHAVDIVHRDLKPSNVFLERRPDGSARVKLLDFGISKLPKSVAKVTLTEPGQNLGSLMFMPPEQIQHADAVDRRADIYALGTLTFQALTGFLPYHAKTAVDLIGLKASSEPRSLAQASGRAFPEPLEAWLQTALRRDPSYRFQSAEEALSAWQALLPLASPHASPMGAPLLFAAAWSSPEQAAHEAPSPHMVTLQHSQQIHAYAPDQQPRQLPEGGTVARRIARGTRWIWALTAVILLCTAGLAGAVVHMLTSPRPTPSKSR